MEEETTQLPASPQEVQIQPPSFWDKLKIHRLKILGGVLGILVFAGAVFGAYKFGQRQIQPGPKPTPTPGLVATPTPDPTANWKSYTSTKHGFSLKYPSEISLKEQKEGGYDFVVLTLWGPTQGRDTEFYDGISLWFSSGLLGTKTLKEFVDNEVEQAKENAEILQSPTTIVIGSVSGYIYRVRGLGESSHIYLPKKPGGYIRIINSTVDPTGKGFQETVDLILSTFRFLDSSPEGQFCGGIAGVECPAGYRCQLEGNYPDAGGKCVRE